MVRDGYWSLGPRRTPFGPSTGQGNGCSLDLRKGALHMEPLGAGGRCLAVESEASVFHCEGLSSFALAVADLPVH